MAEEINWKGLALGMGAHLEHLELHCQVKTDKVGAAHAHEGCELREAGKKYIALLHHAVATEKA